MTTRIFLGFQPDPARPVGGNGVNLEVCRVIRESFDETRDPSRATLQVHAFNWTAPPAPRRVFIDHGAFADAGFWACTATRLRKDDVVLVGASVCTRIAQRMLVSPGPRIARVPFGVDTGFFTPAVDRAAARSEMRPVWGIPAEGRLILVAAGFSRRKNHHLAIHLLHRLLDRVPDARLAIAGGVGSKPSRIAYRASLETLAGRLGIADRVHFLGSLERGCLRDLMQSADLLVHLSTCRIENFGLVVAEALACGVPVVAADWGGLRDLVSPGIEGFLARTHLSATGPRVDWLSAAGRAADVLRDPALEAMMRVAARARAVERLDAALFRARVSGLFRELVRDGGDDGGAVRLSPAGEDLMIRTLDLHLRNPGIRETSEEFRLLMGVDEGRHYRLLAGPAATCENPPRIGPGDFLYPGVTFEYIAGGVRITDPAWETRMQLSPASLEILRGCGGGRSISGVFDALGLPSPDRAAALDLAQQLVDAGLLCPSERTVASARA